MRIPLFAAVSLACATALAAQTGTTTSKKTTTGANKSATQIMTLSGCIAQGPTANDPLRLSNATVMKGTTSSAPTGSGDITAARKGNAATNSYVLSGADVHRYVGQRVQVIGSMGGGNAPTVVHGSEETVGTTGTTPPTLPVFQVQSVKAFGPCPQG